MFKKMIENYKKPTPKKWRKVGDTLLAMSTLAIPLELTDHKYLAISLFIFAVVGKFLTNFFADDAA
jgi:hypothetical protein